MSEVEKMYENAGIKAKWKDKRVKNAKTYYTEEQAKYLRQTTKNRNIQLLYPPFTAEKQLELIKWLAGFWVHINDVGGQINISTGGGYVSYYAENLADAIALCINSKWNNLTEQERTEIAEILRG